MIDWRVPNRSTCCCTLLAASAAVLISSGVAAQSVVGARGDIGSRSELLGAWLEAQAAQQKKERRFTGGSALTVGAAGLGFGLGLLIKPPNNELSVGGGVALTAAGAVGVALGIFRLVVESEAEKLARRYRATANGDLGDAELGRFEGEFYAASRHAQRVQQLARWLGLATAVAGVAVLITTPFVDLSKGGWVAGYTAGALLVLGGGVNFASSFGTPPPMKAWKAFRRGQAPTHRSRRLFGIVPTFRKHHAGVALLILADVRRGGL